MVKNIIARAKETVYYRNKRIREGQVFICHNESEFSHRSMEDVKGVLPKTADLKDEEAQQLKAARESGAPVPKEKKFVEIDGQQVEVVDTDDDSVSAAADPVMTEATAPAAAGKPGKPGKGGKQAPAEQAAPANTEVI